MLLSTILAQAFRHHHLDPSSFAPPLLVPSLSRCLGVFAPATTAMASGIFASPFAGSWDRLIKRKTEPTKRLEPAPTLPLIDAADDDWALGTTSSLHLALAEAKAAFVSENTTATTLAPARLDTKPIIMATDQDILPPALCLPSISDSTSGWVDDLTSMLRLFSSMLMDLTIVECAPIPAPIVETPGVTSDDDLSECDSSASDSSFDSLFDTPSRPASPHTDQSTSISNSSSSSLDSANHNAALILCSEAFNLVPCTLEPRPGDVGGRTIPGFLTFPNLNYQKPETIDDDDTEAVFDTSCHALEAWNSDSFSGATAARNGKDGALDKAEDDENNCAVPQYALKIYDKDTVGSFSTSSAGQLDQQQAEEQDIPLLELFAQRQLADLECPVTNWVGSATGLLTMGESKDESTATTVENNDELDAVFELEWAKYEAEYDADPDTLATADTWDTCQALTSIHELNNECPSGSAPFIIRLDDDDDGDC